MELKELVQRAKNYDLEALGQIYELFVDKIYKYIFFKIGDRTEAEDLTEQVFLKMLQAIRNFRPRKTPFSAWLFKIASNVVTDYYRTHSRYLKVPLEEATEAESESVEERVLRDFSSEKLYMAITKLTGEQQNVIILKFLMGLSNLEVAQILKKSEGAIKSLQHRALNSLAKILKGGSRGRKK